mmetsp:Transcript_105803/g.147515  ORF Transcript_105803/g.147515 Transcript_105803/m.147515 type:complete len:201 (+) Transcript_105803:878-1480(+)
MRVVSFVSSTHLRRYSLLCSSSCQMNLISSKPSSFSGMVKFANALLKTDGVKSGTAPFGRKLIFSSSSVSSTFGGSSSTSSASSSSSSSSSSISTSFSSSSSSGTSCPSASAFFRSASFLAFSAAFFISSSFFWRSFSAFFFAFSISFIFFSAAFFLAASSFFILNSLSDCSCFSASMSSWLIFTKSLEASPTTTLATFL